MRTIKKQNGNYISPVAEIVELSLNQTILAGSLEGLTIDTGDDENYWDE